MHSPHSLGITLLVAAFSGIAIWPEAIVGGRVVAAPAVAVADVQLAARDLARAVLWLGDGALPVGDRYERSLAELTGAQRAAVWRLVELHGAAVGPAFLSDALPALHATAPQSVRFAFAAPTADQPTSRWSLVAPAASLTCEDPGQGAMHLRAEWHKPDGPAEVVSLGAR